MNAYYSTQRPAGPGAVPKDKLLEVVNLDTMPEIDEDGTRAYSIMLYDRRLSESELREYELTESGITICGSDIREFCIRDNFFSHGTI